MGGAGKIEAALAEVSKTDILSNISEYVNPLLILVLVIVILFTISGYRRGFIKLAVSLITMIMGFYLVSVAMPYVNDFLKTKTDIHELLVENINEAFADINSSRDNTVYENQVETINEYRLPAVVKKMLLSENVQEVYEKLSATIFEEYVSRYLADIVLKALSFIFTYVMVMILVKITILSAEFMSSLPVIKGVNKVIGGGFGFLEGVFIVFIGFALATFIIGKPFYEMVEKSRLLRLIYDNNVILKLFLSH